jgi:amino acid transporter
MVVFVMINLIGIRWLANANTGITTWKVIIPLLTIVVLLITHFHGTTSRPVAASSSPAASATRLEGHPGRHTGSGIVFSLLGFEQAVQLGGESANPQRDLPRAVIGSILIGAAIYILLQVAFIGALNPATIAHYHTWAQPGQDKRLGAGPFYTVAKVAGLAWLAWILRVDAVISPAGPASST